MDPTEKAEAPPTKIQKRQERRKAKEEEKSRAAASSRALYLANYEVPITFRNLTSDISWIADLINPDITMSYHSIKEKITNPNFGSVKNCSGSRRKLTLKSAPSGEVVYCYFHEPHPDDPLGIEKWRRSLVDRLIHAGYYKKTEIEEDSKA